MRESEEHERNKYLMVDDYILDKIFDTNKEIIVIKKSDDTKILVETDDNCQMILLLKNL